MSRPRPHPRLIRPWAFLRRRLPLAAIRAALLAHTRPAPMPVRVAAEYPQGGWRHGH